MKKPLLVTLLLTMMLVSPLPTMARLDIDIHIAPPPAVVFVQPPELIVIPGTYIYAVPDTEMDIFFFDGWWWRSWNGRWYRSPEYNSGWVYYEYVPSFYREIPRDWRHFYRERRWHGREWDYRRIPYSHVHRNWRDWRRDRYWEHQKTWGVRDYYPRRSEQPYRDKYPRQYRRQDDNRGHGRGNDRWRGDDHGRGDDRGRR